MHVGPIPVTIEYEAKRINNDSLTLWRITDAYVEDSGGGNKVDVLDYFMGEDFAWLERELDPCADEIIGTWVEHSWVEHLDPSNV